MGTHLSASEITNRLVSLPGWAFEGNALVRQFAFKAFPDSVSFVTRLAFEAEAEDHHPDLTVSYRKVTVTWSTHSEGGVTEKDFAGAAKTDAIAKMFTATGAAV